MSNLQNVKLPIPDVVVSAIGTARRLIQQLAQPWLVQLVLRLALAVPFWKSGILKWHGFLQLNDTAIDLFTDEFKLHLPGGPYPFPAPAVFARPASIAATLFATRPLFVLVISGLLSTRYWNILNEPFSRDVLPAKLLFTTMIVAGVAGVLL